MIPTSEEPLPPAAPSAHPNQHTPWPPAVLELARKLWALGRSASQVSQAIFDELGVVKTRNAVVAIMHRQHFEQGAKPATISAARSSPAPRRRGPVATTRLGPPAPNGVASLEAALAEAALHPRRIGIMELTAASCRYPLNDGGPFVFCGAGSFNGWPYCAAHARLCYDRIRTAAPPSGDAGRLPKQSTGGAWR